jgi:hypothetical protein
VPLWLIICSPFVETITDAPFLKVKCEFVLLEFFAEGEGQMDVQAE